MSYAFRAPTVAEAAARGQDNFGLLRLTLAVAVVCSHAYSIPTGRIASEPLYAVTGYTLGEHAVNGFFAVSGFLVAMSFDRQKNPLHFAAARLLRVFPGLIVATLATALLIGGAMTSLPLETYLADAKTWSFVSVTVTSFKSATALPGVFGDNPLPFPLATVWTLRYELFCYAGLFAFGLLGGFRFPRLVGLAIGAVVAALMIGALAGGLSKGQETALRLPLVFMGGMALHLFRDQVRVSLWLLGGLVATTIAAALIAPFAYKPFLFVTTAYAAITLALAPSVVAPRLQPRDDLSYGVYLYGWPVQQALHALFPAMPATLSIAPALATTLLIAFLSWRLIERPALALKPSSRRGH